MEIGKVIGTVVATRKDASLQGMRLLVVQHLDKNKNPVGRPLIALDTECLAGYGELVFTVSGGDAALVLPGKELPVDVAVVGIVDSIKLTDELG